MTSEYIGEMNGLSAFHFRLTWYFPASCRTSKKFKAAEWTSMRTWLLSGFGSGALLRSFVESFDRGMFSSMR